MSKHADGMATSRYIDELLYQVKPTEWNVFAVPLLTVMAATLLAAVPSALRAVHLDPARVLRAG